MMKWMLINISTNIFHDTSLGKTIQVKGTIYHFIFFHVFWSIFSTVTGQMVYKYKWKMDRGSSWTEASMSAALEAIKSTTSPMGIREAAREFDIPYVNMSFKIALKR